MHSLISFIPLLLKKQIAYIGIAPVCNHTLPVIGLQIPCMEKAGVALDALQLSLSDVYPATLGITFSV